jgi:hypothetical protein
MLAKCLATWEYREQDFASLLELLLDIVAAKSL